MNILLNIYPVQSGGGQQVASNFIKTIAENNLDHNWFFFVGDGSELDILVKINFPENHILSIPYSYLQRVRSTNKLNSFIKKNCINIIYNYSPVLPVKNIPQVVRSVYSNLYFPEIPFWVGYSFMASLRKKLIDNFRLKGTLKANGLIFENEAMQDRAINLFKYAAENTVYIAPSVSTFDTSETVNQYNILQDLKTFKILYLSSWHLNKNIHLLPNVASILFKNNIEVKFVLSLESSTSEVAEHLMKEIERLDVREFFTFIGKVKATHVHQVVSNSDAMILLSKLECFSSNVVEAFYFNKPLIIADEEWARRACDDAAYFVSRDNVEEIAQSIIQLVTNKEIINDLIDKGKKRLKHFNTPEEKVKKQVDFLEYIYEKSKGNC